MRFHKRTRTPPYLFKNTCMAAFRNVNPNNCGGIQFRKVAIQPLLATCPLLWFLWQLFSLFLYYGLILGSEFCLESIPRLLPTCGHAL